MFYLPSESNNCENYMNLINRDRLLLNNKEHENIGKICTQVILQENTTAIKKKNKDEQTNVFPGQSIINKAKIISFYYSMTFSFALV